MTPAPTGRPSADATDSAEETGPADEASQADEMDQMDRPDEMDNGAATPSAQDARSVANTQQPPTVGRPTDDAPEQSLRCLLHDEGATARLAEALAPPLSAGMRVYLSGDLGTGKTTLVRALLRALGHTGRARSPSFSLLEPYNLSRFDVYHFDFYRLSHESSWLEAGFDEYLGGQGVSIVEWPEMAGDSLPPADLVLRLAFSPTDGEHARQLVAHARGGGGVACLNAIRDAGCCAAEPELPLR